MAKSPTKKLKTTDLVKQFEHEREKVSTVLKYILIQLKLHIQQNINIEKITPI